jgi:hypothetical protein
MRGLGQGLEQFSRLWLAFMFRKMIIYRIENVFIVALYIG